MVTNLYRAVTLPKFQEPPGGRLLPPAQTYLENELVKIHMKTIERNPEAGESVYRRLMRAVLACLFPPNEGYEVVQEDDRGGRPDFVVFKISCRPGGSAYTYAFCIIESKAKGAPWSSTEDQCANACFETENEVKKVYAMVHIGPDVGFYRYEDGDFTSLSGKLHLRHDVGAITERAEHIKDRPYPFVKV